MHAHTQSIYRSNWGTGLYGNIGWKNSNSSRILKTRIEISVFMLNWQIFDFSTLGFAAFWEAEEKTTKDEESSGNATKGYIEACRKERRKSQILCETYLFCNSTYCILGWCKGKKKKIYCPMGNRHIRFIEAGMSSLNPNFISTITGAV